MAVKVDDPRDIDSAYKERFNDMTSSPDLQEFESSMDNTYGDDFKKLDNSGDLGAEARAHEQNSSSTWADNTTKTAPKTGPEGMKGLLQKGKVLLKNKGATAAIVAVLGLGGTVPFLSASSLPFAIVGNMNAKSMLLGLSQYNQDFLSFKLFGAKTASVQNGAKGKLAGLTESEIAQLKENGIEFKGNGEKNKLTGKTTFTEVRYKDGAWLKAGEEFSTEMSKNPAFRKALIYEKKSISSLWKAYKNSAAASVKSLLGISSNPDISGENDTERNKKMYAAATEGVDESLGKSVNNQGSDEDVSKGQGIDDIGGEAGSEIEANRAAFSEG